MFENAGRLYYLAMLVPDSRSTLHRRIRQLFLRTTGILTPEEFRLCFRTNRHDCIYLALKVEGALRRNERMGAFRNGVLEPAVRVAIVVRILSRA